MVFTVEGMDNERMNEVKDQTTVRSPLFGYGIALLHFRGRCPPGDGKWMELEFAGGSFGTS